MLRIQQLRLSLDEPKECLEEKIIKKLHIHKEDLLEWHLRKESIDARKQNDFHFNCCVDCKVKNEDTLLKKKIKDVTKAPDESYTIPACGMVGLSTRPVVVGFGPAGMFASLLLAQAGFRPIVIERGECVEERVKSVQEFWEKGILKENSNVQFGLV